MTIKVGPHNLEAILVATEAIGVMHLTKMEKGWWAYIDIPAPVGCDAKVKSDTSHKTPSAAVQQVLDRLSGLRRNMGAAPLQIEGHTL